jgi:hypothetical protein
MRVKLNVVNMYICRNKPRVINTSIDRSTTQRNQIRFAENQMLLAAIGFLFDTVCEGWARQFIFDWYVVWFLLMFLKGNFLNWSHKFWFLMSSLRVEKANKFHKKSASIVYRRQISSVKILHARRLDIWTSQFERAICEF